MTQASQGTGAALKIPMEAQGTSGHQEWWHSGNWLVSPLKFLFLASLTQTILPYSLIWRKLVGKCLMSIFAGAKISWNGACEKATLEMLSVPDAFMLLCIPCAWQWQWLPPEGMAMPTCISGAQVLAGTLPAGSTDRPEDLGFHASRAVFKQWAPHLLPHLSAGLSQGIFYVFLSLFPSRLSPGCPHQ